MHYLRIILMLFFLIQFFFTTITHLYAQQITNIRAEQEGNNIIIYYDIIEAKQDQKFKVSVHYSTDGGQHFSSALKSVSGDVEDNVTPGSSKKIIWNVLQEREKLIGDDIRFEVRASIIRSIIEMVYIEGGTLRMGSNTGDDDEKPEHVIMVKSFYIQKYQVTQKQWREVMGQNPSGFSGCENCPVESISWNDIQEFLKKLNAKTGKNYRLPTEAEWEFTARGGNKSKGYNYSGSNNINEVAWYNSNSKSKTQPVGQKKSNELGIYDMSGNVWEWCSDWYSNNYYSISPPNDPQGPSTGKYKVLRGGSWSDYESSCRVANRFWYNPDSIYNDSGFRLARD
jgi:sulfatase modifying factor 1